jgi:hypothetical protein
MVPIGVIAVKAGSLKMMAIGPEDPHVINGKFAEYLRVREEQEPGSRVRAAREGRMEFRGLPKIERSTYSGSMRRTFFEKLPSDRFNFYKPPIKEIARDDHIFELTLQRHLTFNSRTTNTKVSKASTTRPSYTMEVMAGSTDRKVRPCARTVGITRRR